MVSIRPLLAGLVAGAVVVSAAAREEIANLAADFNTTDAVPRTQTNPGSQFNENGWSFATKAGTALTYDTDLINNAEINFNDGPLEQEGVVAGYNTDADIFNFIPGFPLISDQDIFSRGRVAQEGDILAFHAGDDNQNEQLVITWTADQDYTDVVLDYEIERILGLHESVDDATDRARTISMQVTGPSGTGLVSLTPAFPDGRQFTDHFKTNKYNDPDDPSATHPTLLIGDVDAGQTIVITIGQGDNSPGGDGSVGNFIISGNVPEPGSLALLGLGGLLVARRRRQA